MQVGLRVIVRTPIVAHLTSFGMYAFWATSAVVIVLTSFPVFLALSLGTGF
jgi:hypothetical protein